MTQTTPADSPAAVHSTVPVACPVCGSVLCVGITAAASAQWKADLTRRERQFAEPARFQPNTVDPGTVCQTTRRPIPGRAVLEPERRPQGRRGRASHAGNQPPAGE